MSDLLNDLRAACRIVARRAASVRVMHDAIAGYAGRLMPPAPESAGEPSLEGPATDERPATDGDRSLQQVGALGDPAVELPDGTSEERAAFWLTLDAINFGSGWFPILRKRRGRSGYFTIAAGVRERFATRRRWTADELAQIDGTEIAAVLGQDPTLELMELFASSLRDLGAHVVAGYNGEFAQVVDDAGGSAVALVETLAGWDGFSDSSAYDELTVPFLKRAQIAAADLSRAGLGGFRDLGALTMFADNLVPHVLRLDGILQYDPELVARIERGELIEHGSREEVEIRACAVHAVELIVAAHGGARAADIDQLLWNRGQAAAFKAAPRHRTRCTAY